MKPFSPPAARIRARVFRRESADVEKAHTLIKLGAVQFRLPRGWRGRSNESARRVRTYDQTVAAVRAEIERQLEAAGGNPDLVNCDIVASPPHGGVVPHGDVVALLDGDPCWFHDADVSSDLPPPRQ